MKPAPYSMLLEAASRYNILTLTTSCAASCVFCSHNQNPKEIEAYYINKLTKEDAENLIEFLDKDSKITIGESATRICEGEPFAFDYLMDILKLVRAKYSDTPIQITTSGIYLNEPVLKELQTIGNIELNISLNSSSREGRRKIYSGKDHMQAVEAMKLLKNYGIKFNGSIVAMPHVVGWDDLEQTIIYIADCGASAIRVFVPGYTKYTKIPLPQENINKELQAMAKALQKKLKTPIVVEPTAIDNLAAQAAGIIAGSPADIAGLKADDIILTVNGKQVYSRADAFNRLYELSEPKVSYKRAGKVMNCTIDKNKNLSSGLVFNYDIDFEEAERIKRTVKKLSSKRCLMLVSGLGYGIMKKVLEDYNELEIRVAENSFLGGNIRCAGLLIIEDIADSLKQLDIMPEVVFLPEIMFDEKGRDLTGRHYMELEQEYGVTVIVL